MIIILNPGATEGDLILSDTSSLFDRLCLRPAENSEFIISLWLPWIRKTVYAFDAAGSGGFALVEQYPGGTSIVIHAPCAKSARRLFLEVNPRPAALNVTSREVAEALGGMFGFAVLPEDHFHYAASADSFSPADGYRECVKPIGADGVGRLLEFVAEENELSGDDPRYADLKSRIEAGDSWTYVAEEDGDMVGYIEINAAAKGTPLWEVDLVYTTPRLRGGGIGRKLISAATGDALAAGLVPLYTVSADNIPSIKACEAVGYYRCLTRWRLVPPS